MPTTEIDVDRLEFLKSGHAKSTGREWTLWTVHLNAPVTLDGQTYTTLKTFDKLPGGVVGVELEPPADRPGDLPLAKTKKRQQASGGKAKQRATTGLEPRVDSLEDRVRKLEAALRGILKNPDLEL